MSTEIIVPESKKSTNQSKTVPLSPRASAPTSPHISIVSETRTSLDKSEGLKIRHSSLGVSRVSFKSPEDSQLKDAQDLPGSARGSRQGLIPSRQSSHLSLVKLPDGSITSSVQFDLSDDEQKLESIVVDSQPTLEQGLSISTEEEEGENQERENQEGIEGSLRDERHLESIMGTEGLAWLQGLPGEYEVFADRFITDFPSMFPEDSVAPLSEKLLLCPAPSVEELPIDRSIYYELYALFSKQQRFAILKHKMLEKKVADYYKTRKMFNVLYSDDESAEQRKKYERQLNEFDSFLENYSREKLTLEEEIANLKRKCADRKRQMNAIVEDLEKKQQDMIKEMVSGGQSKEAAEKLVDRYLRRQRAQRNSLINARNFYIALRNKHDELQNQVNALEYLGPNYRLMDYEQLKTDSNNLNEKMEEKEMELALLAKKARNTNQTLAHFREKAISLEVNMEKFKNELDLVTNEVLEAREELHFLKKSREGVRQATLELRGKIGLLALPKALKDMEHDLRELLMGKVELEKCKEQVEESSKLISEANEQLETFKFNLKYSDDVEPPEIFQRLSVRFDVSKE